MKKILMIVMLTITASLSAQQYNNFLWDVGFGVQKHADHEDTDFIIYGDWLGNDLNHTWGAEIGFYGATPSDGGVYCSGNSCNYNDPSYGFGYDDGGILVGLRYGRVLNKFNFIGTLGADFWGNYYYDGYYNEKVDSDTRIYAKGSIKYTGADWVAPEIGYGTHGLFVGISLKFN